MQDIQTINRQLAATAMLSILSIMVLVVASNTLSTSSTGAASGYNMPDSACMKECKYYYGPGFIGTHIGKAGNAAGATCICKDASYVYKPGYWPYGYSN